MLFVVNIGQDVFVVMTHADEVSASTIEELSVPVDAAEGKHEEDVASTVLQNLRTRLSAAFCGVVPDSLPESHIFLVENYRLGTHDPAAEIDFAVLECFELIVASAARYVSEHATNPSKCVVS